MRQSRVQHHMRYKPRRQSRPHSVSFFHPAAERQAYRDSRGCVQIDGHGARAQGTGDLGAIVGKEAVKGNANARGAT